MTDKFDYLRKAAFVLINDEDLPKPYEIKFRSPLNGTRKQNGRCFNTARGFRILVSTVKAKYVEDGNGKLTQKVTGKRFRQIMGTDRTDKELIDILAHEISHLKFWKHGADHTQYEKDLISKLELKIK